jgi:hypothetical protein
MPLGLRENGRTENIHLEEAEKIGIKCQAGLRAREKNKAAQRGWVARQAGRCCWEAICSAKDQGSDSIPDREPQGPGWWHGKVNTIQ